MGKKSSSAPDYTQLNQTSAAAIASGERISNRMMDFSERQYEEMQPYAQRIADAQAAGMEQQFDQSADLYQYNVDTFRPLEQGLVADAGAYSEQSNRDRLAGDAAAASARAFGNNQQMLNRSDAARGLNPNSAASRALRQQGATSNAATRAALMTGVDNQAQQQGYNMRMGAAGLGRGLPGMATNAAGAAGNLGTGAMGVIQQPGGAFMAGMQGAGNMANQGYQTGLGGYGQVMQGQVQTRGQNMERTGALIGGALGMVPSDRRLKEDIELHHVDTNSGLNVYTYRYKGVPDRRFMGVMADEAKLVFPDAVTTDNLGFDVVDYAAMGMRFIEVTEEAA